MEHGAGDPTIHPHAGPIHLQRLEHVLFHDLSHPEEFGREQCFYDDRGEVLADEVAEELQRRRLSRIRTDHTRVESHRG